MIGRRAVAPLAAALLAGCQAGPAVRTDLAASGLEVPAGWSGASDPGPAPTGWVADFDDPRLAALVGEAVAANFDLRAAAARIGAARARARIAGATLLPSVDAGADATRRGAPAAGGRATGNAFEATLDVAWEIDVWGRLGDTARGATLEADAAAADWRAARLSLAASTAQAWFDAVRAGTQVALSEETVANFAENLSIVEERFRRGLASALDVRLERANLAGAESALAARRIERDAAVRGLEVLLGRYPGARIAIPQALPVIVAPVPVGLPADLLERRPDVRAAALRLAARDSELSAALKNRLPAIALTGSGGLTSTELRTLLDFDSLLWRLAASLAAPILDGGRLDAERDLARAQGAGALAEYAGTVLVAFREVESALTAESLLERQEAALDTAATESEAAAALALERYRAGLVDIVTWLEARRRAFDSRSSLLAVSAQRLRNRVTLYLALGGDFAQPEASVEPAPVQARAVPGPGFALALEETLR